MSRPRWRKITADLKGNLVRSALVTASIAVGLFAVGVIFSLYVLLRQDMDQGYALTNPANIQIQTSAFQPNFLDTLKNIDGVDEVEGFQSFNLRARNRSGEWQDIHFKAVQDFSKTRLNQVELIQGTLQPAKHQLLLDRFKNTDFDLQPGKMMEIRLPSGKIRQMEVAGLIKDQSIGATSTAGGFFLAPAQVYIQTDDLTWLEQPDALNYLMLTVSSDKNDLAHIRAVSEQVKDAIEKAGLQIYNISRAAATQHPNSAYSQAMGQVMLLLSVLVMFLSGFLMTNTLQALLNQQINQIGVMKIIGGRRRQIIWIYVELVCIFSLIALLLSAPLASISSYRLLEFLADRVNFSASGFRVALPGMLLVILMAVFIPQGAALIPILRGVKITPQQAISGIRQENIIKPAPPWLTKALARAQIHRPMLISFRNLFRRKGRLILTLITLMLGGAIFVATINVRYSILDYVARVSKYFVADVNLTLSRPYRIEHIQDILATVPGIDLVEGWSIVRGEIILPDGNTGDSVQVFAPPGDSPLVQPILLKGRWIEPADHNAVAISERFASLFPDLEIGDPLKLQIDGKTTQWQVVGFFQLAGNASGYMVYTDFDSLTAITGSKKSSAIYRIRSDQTNLTLAGQKQLARAAEDALTAHSIDIADASAGLLLSENTTNGLTVLTTFLLIMAFLTASVGSIGLAGTMSMNVMERTREIGIMRAVGATNRIIIKLVLSEGAMIGVISWLLSLAISFPISKLMSDVINTAIFGAPTGFTYSILGPILWMFIVIVLSLAASIIPAESASRLTIREVLAYE